MRSDRRKNAATLAVVVLVCLAALGGLFVMQEMLARREQRILNRSESIPIVSGEGREAAGSRKTELTPKELVSALKSMESQSGEEAHEPFGNQLSMKDAIEKGTVWLREFYGRYAGVEEEFDSFKKISAVLVAKPEDEKNELNSYWEISYNTNYWEITLWLNAVTGQVLRAVLTSRDVQMSSFYYVDKFLKNYGKSFSLKAKNKISSLYIDGDDRNIYAQPMNHGIYLVFTDADFMVSDRQDGKTGWKVGTVREVYLCTKLPGEYQGAYGGTEYSTIGKSATDSSASNETR